MEGKGIISGIIKFSGKISKSIVIDFAKKMVEAEEENYYTVCVINLEINPNAYGIHFVYRYSYEENYKKCLVKHKKKIKNLLNTLYSKDYEYKVYSCFYLIK